MAEMENITFLFKINSTRKEDFIVFLSNVFKDIEPQVEYECTWFWDDEYYIDAIDFAVDIDQSIRIEAYGKNELTFGFFDKILENTEGDFLLANQGDIILIRKNGIVMAIDSFDYYSNCSFKNCDKLLQTNHLIGYQNEYYLELKFSEGVDVLKNQLYNILADLLGNTDDIKIIEHEMRRDSFALFCEHFGFTVDKEGYTDEKNVYNFWIHFTYYKAIFDSNYKFLKKFISLILDKYELSEKYKEKIKDYDGENLDYFIDYYLKSF